VGAGTTQITVSKNGAVSPPVTLTVTAVTLVSIAITPNPAFVAPGNTQQLAAIGTFSDSSQQNLSSQVTWTSSVPTTATISTTGLSTGVQLGGPVTITAALGGVSATDGLTVEAPPNITSQPASLTVNQGQTATFMVSLTGTAPFTYQWVENGQNITGAVSSTYTTAPTAAGDMGDDFYVNISNAVGTVSSSEALLTVLPTPTKYYIDSSAGSDSNSGLTEAAPWQHAPGMASCLGNCAQVTLNPGDQVILKGGTTWNQSNFPMEISWSGVTGIPVYYGVDKTWFSGSQWTRPVFDLSGTVWTTAPIFLDSVQDVVLDNLEIRNEQIDSINQGLPRGAITVFAGQGNTIQNCYIHGWSIQNPTNSSDNNPFGGIVFFDDSYGGTIRNCVLDGSPNGDSGVGIWGGTTIQGNIIENLPLGILTADSGAQISGNQIFGVGYSADPTVTPNALVALSNANVFNNVVHDIVPGASAFVLQATHGQGNTQTLYNNLIWNVGTGPAIDILAGNEPGQYAAPSVFNNTIVAGASACIGVQPSSAPLASLTVENNQCVSDQTNAPAWCWNAASGSANCGSVVTLTFQNNVLMSSSVAATQGYTLQNSFQPTSAAAGTVGAGLNLSASCATFGSALCSDLLGLARPGGASAWDAGAYMFQSSAVNLAPSITSQPVSQSVTSGQTATFSVTATGSATLGYQWQENGANIPGANSPSYTTPAATTSALFSVVVSNSSGSVTSSPAILTVTTGAGQLTPASSSVAFPNGVVGTNSTMSLAINNSGTSPVTILGVSELGAEFSASGIPVGLVLAPGQTATLNVTFSPSVTGPASASVTLSSTASNPSITISLSGTAFQLLPHTSTLSWGASTSPVVGYNVYRSLQKTGPFTLLNSSLVGATTYVDSTVVSGATYYYVVTSVDSNGNESPPSNVSSDTIPFP